MKAFEVVLSVKPKVKIHNPEKLVNAVCNKNSPFCKAFYTYSDIEDFADSFCKQFYYERAEFKKLNGDKDCHYYKFVEGYGRFKQDDSGLWSLVTQETIEEMGMIQIEFDNDAELEVEWGATEV